MNKKKIDLRDAYFNGLFALIKRHKDVMVLTADHGAFGLNRIKEIYPSQYLNVGIAEQNMVSVAAGLALSGKTVYIYSIINFVTIRCLEQISIDIASMNLNVNIIGVGAGFTYSTDGPTHHGTQDIAIMSAIPNFSIYNCSDKNNTEVFSKLGYYEKGPKYFRIEKGIMPNLYDKKNKFEEGLSKIRTGDGLCILSTGLLIHKILEIVDSLIFRNQNIGVIDLYRIKPINDLLLITLLKKTKKLLIIEDNIASGGLGEKISSIILENNLNVIVKKISIDDSYIFNYNNKRDLVEDFSGLGSNVIMENIKKLLINCN